MMILGKKFFNRSAVVVARELVGKFLVRNYKGKKIALMITETEAYEGPYDRASHASRGLTPRNKVMFGPPGFWYLYFVYGIHWMINITAGPMGHPAAVLIRGTKEVSGPGRLTKFLKLNKKFNEKPANKNGGLWIEDRGIKIGKSTPTPRHKKSGVRGSDRSVGEFKIKKGPRIGVAYAGPVWAKKPYRFWVDF